MRVKIGGKIKNFRTIWMKGKTVRMIDQTKLPYKFEIYDSLDFKQTAEAIKKMIVRGAPAIGVAAGFGIAQAILDAPEDRFEEFLKHAVETLRDTRPTAQNLFWTIDRILKIVIKGKNVSEKKKLAVDEANKIADEDVETCKKIGEYGDKLIKDGDKILTHCNAGALATVDYGTALAPIRFAHYEGKKIFVFVDETRPRCQGSRLTAWELSQEGIEHAIIADNAAGYFMQKGEIDLVIVGADRILSNGLTANKIGTYEKAVLAKENEIPFYVAAPTSSFDLKSKEIPIEKRSQDEILYMFGLNDEGKFSRVRIAPKKSQALNPAFDTTPAKFITSFITEKGILKPKDFRKLFK
ncbi:MAG: S-methyl-5-thioribose-1-phosphate isomerase [Candidatus Aenigmarchaeota archaeon]|nr:S-methyl-5-thioribose-1-phosphate isomerase [Candidatus Aenigmarchaeota archaeon]